VLDHFSRAAIDKHLNDIAEPLLSSFGDHPPYAVFSDSLEVYVLIGPLTYLLSL